MPSTGKTKKSKGGKKNNLLAKPKRPMSAYNFFFRAERANILSESNNDNDSGNRTSFEDIGRIIGQRWRNIEETELAEYKRMAKEDNERYRDQMKTFYKDELTLMCLGHNDNDTDSVSAPAMSSISNDGAAGDSMKRLGDATVVSINNGNGHLPKSEEGGTAASLNSPAAPIMAAAVASTGGLDQKLAAAQIMDIVQQQQQQQQQPSMLMNHAGQSQLNPNQASQIQATLANHHRAGAAAGMLNAFHNTYNLQNHMSSAAAVAGGGGNSLASLADPMRSIQSKMEQQKQQDNVTNITSANASSLLASTTGSMNDDQILQLLLQHQQSASVVNAANGRKVPNETVIALILTQKASIQQRQQKLTEELKALQFKNTLLDKMLANEVSTVPSPGQQNNVGVPQASSNSNNVGVGGAPLSGAIGAPSPLGLHCTSDMGGGVGGKSSSHATTTTEQLLQALQQQKPSASTDASLSSYATQPTTTGGGGGSSVSMFGNAAPAPGNTAAAISNAAAALTTNAPVPPMQELLYRNVANVATSQQTASASAALTQFMQNAQSAMNNDATGNNVAAAAAAAAAVNHQGNSAMTMEEMFMKQFMDRGKGP